MADNKLLTVKFSEQMLAELHAAADILGYRTSSALVHQLASQKIREAKNSVSDEEFSRTYQEKLSEMRERSREKSPVKITESAKMVITEIPYGGKLGTGEKENADNKKKAG